MEVTTLQRDTGQYIPVPGRLTLVVLVVGPAVQVGGGPQVIQAEVGDLEDPARRDDTVGRLQVTVHRQRRVVQIQHTLQ